MAGESVWRRRAPIWLRILAGILIFPAFWVAIALLCEVTLQGWGGSPLPPWLLIMAAVAGALVSFAAARKSSIPVAAIFVALPLLGYAWTFYSLQHLGNAEKPFGEAEQPAPPVRPEGLPDVFNRPSGTGGTPSPQAEAPPPPPDGATHYETEMPEPQARPAEPAQADGGAHYEMAPLPEFPWPPPAASASYVLPDKLLASYHTVGDVVGAILGALERSGYVERSFFRTEAGGVALVTRLERINDDGTPYSETGRWPGGPPVTTRPPACFNSYAACSMSTRATTA